VRNKGLFIEANRDKVMRVFSATKPALMAASMGIQIRIRIVERIRKLALKDGF
jgi:hypothetical protein